MNTTDTIFLNWHILMTIWKIEHNRSSEREKVRFHYKDGDNVTYLDLTFFRLFGVDSRRIYSFVNGGRNLGKKEIERLTDKTNLSRTIFEGTRLLIPVNENDDLYHTFIQFIIKRKNGEHPSKHRDLYKDINKYLKQCKNDLSNSKPIDSELQKAFTYISSGNSSVERQQFILDISTTLTNINYKNLLEIESQSLFTYLKALKNQEKLVVTAITHKKNVK